MDKIRPVSKVTQMTEAQEKDVEKNPPTFQERLQSDSRSNAIEVADLSQDDIDLLKEIGDIKEEYNAYNQIMYSYKLLGKECTSGHNRRGQAYLRIGTKEAMDGNEAEEWFGMLGKFFDILKNQRSSAAIAKLTAEFERPAEQNEEDTNIMQRIRARIRDRQP